MKIAVLGGGGFRTPLAWEALADLTTDVALDEVVLQDIDATRLARIGCVIEGLRAERSGPEIRTTTDLEDAVEGADIIFCAIRVGGLEGRVADETVPLRAGVLGQETIGPGGISFALRTVPIMLDVANVARKYAPSAWFLNFTNPAGLVTESVREVLGDRVVGICDSPAALCGRIAAALGRRPHDLDFEYAGINHLGWLMAVRDGESNLLPGLLAADHGRLARVEEALLFGCERLRHLGMVPNEYLVYYESPHSIVDALRRGGATRAELLLRNESAFYRETVEEPAQALAAWRRTRDLRFGTYMAEAWGAAGSETDPGEPAADEEPRAAGYAGIAASFIRSQAQSRAETVILNVANRGAMHGLDDEAVVELPCTVTAAGPRPRNVRRLPALEADLVARVKEVERLTIRAVVTASRALALDAIAAHPVVPTRDAAERILAGYLHAFPDLAERLQ